MRTGNLSASIIGLFLLRGSILRGPEEHLFFINPLILHFQVFEKSPIYYEASMASNANRNWEDFINWDNETENSEMTEIEDGSVTANLQTSTACEEAVSSIKSAVPMTNMLGLPPGLCISNEYQLPLEWPDWPEASDLHKSPAAFNTGIVNNEYNLEGSMEHLNYTISPPNMTWTNTYGLSDTTMFTQQQHSSMPLFASQVMSGETIQDINSLNTSSDPSLNDSTDQSLIPISQGNVRTPIQGWRPIRPAPISQNQCLHQHQTLDSGVLPHFQSIRNDNTQRQQSFHHWPLPDRIPEDQRRRKTKARQNSTAFCSLKSYNSTAKLKRKAPSGVPETHYHEIALPIVQHQEQASSKRNRRPCFRCQALKKRVCVQLLTVKSHK
jgi:hypothetical protein